MKIITVALTLVVAIIIVTMLIMEADKETMSERYLSLRTKIEFADTVQGISSALKKPKSPAALVVFTNGGVKFELYQEGEKGGKTIRPDGRINEKFGRTMFFYPLSDNGNYYLVCGREANCEPVTVRTPYYLSRTYIREELAEVTVKVYCLADPALPRHIYCFSIKELVDILREQESFATEMTDGGHYSTIIEKLGDWFSKGNPYDYATVFARGDSRRDFWLWKSALGFPSFWLTLGKTTSEISTFAGAVNDFENGLDIYTPDFFFPQKVFYDTDGRKTLGKAKKWAAENSKFLIALEPDIYSKRLYISYSRETLSANAAEPINVSPARDWDYKKWQWYALPVFGNKVGVHYVEYEISVSDEMSVFPGEANTIAYERGKLKIKKL